jgi:hypothetical protein
VQRQAGQLRLALVPLHDGREYAPDVEHLHLERRHAVLVAREVQQVHHDPLEPPRFAAHRLEVAPPRRVVEREVRHVRRVEIGAHRGQRRPQLARDVGQHLAPQPVAGLQRIGARLQLTGHAIERLILPAVESGIGYAATFRIAMRPGEPAAPGPPGRGVGRGFGRERLL